jgi:hypothetical protein
LITEACLVGIPQIIGCVWAETFGSVALGALAGLVMFVFMMHKAGLNMIIAIPLAFLAIFSLYWIFIDTLFQSLMLLVLLFGAAVLGYSLLRFLKR